MFPKTNKGVFNNEKSASSLDSFDGKAYVDSLKKALSAATNSEWKKNGSLGSGAILSWYLVSACFAILQLCISTLLV